MKRLWLALGLVVLVATLAKTSRAHDPFEITAIARANAQALVVEVTMARSTALRLATGSTSARATFAPEAFADYRAKLEALGPSLYAITSGERALPLRTRAVALTDEDDVQVTLASGSAAGGRLRIRASHLAVLPEGYTSALNVIGESAKFARFKLLTAQDPLLELDLPAASGPTSAAPSSVEEPWSARFGRFLVVGIEHVLTGFDHLLFLVGVLIGCRALRSMVLFVTCFTVAHSLTLGLAVLGHVSAPASVVEPVIAASVVVVGLENLWAPLEIRRRLVLTFAFGLVHGLGFAGALGELGVARAEVPLTLFAFNVGVELGQLAVAAVVLPLLIGLRSTEQGPRGLRLASAAVCATGLVWFVERVA